MPRLIFPFEAKALYLSQNQTFTEPSADFSKVSYFDKNKEKVINPSMPYISENLVSQPFKNQNMTLEKGLYLHFILPDFFRSDKLLPDGTYDLPPIPNRWLIVKNNSEKFIVESDYLYPEYTKLFNKVTIPIPWKVFEEKQLNVPFRYIGRQYKYTQPTATQHDYWYNLMPEPLSAEGSGDPSFVGFLPNCKDVLTFHDTSPAIDDEYEIWGWYDLGENTSKHIDSLFKNIQTTANTQFSTFQSIKNVIDLATKYASGTLTDLSTVNITAAEKTALIQYLELDHEITQKLSATTLSNETIEYILHALMEKDGIELKLFIQKAINANHNGQDGLSHFLSSCTSIQKQTLAKHLNIETALKEKLDKNTSLTNNDKSAIATALKTTEKNKTYAFKQTETDFEQDLLIKEWEVNLNGDYISTGTDHDILLYSKIKINNLNELATQNTPNNYELAVGNSGTEAISAFVAQKLKNEEKLNTFKKSAIENVLEAVQFDSLIGDGVDIGSRFVAARHEKTFRTLEGGIKYMFDFEITPASDETAEENQAFKKLIQEDLYKKVAELQLQLYHINSLQAEYDKNIRIIQSKRHQLFADWYKYMISAHPPYMQDQDYPKADDVLRFIYGHGVEDISTLIIATGFLEISAATSIPKAKEGIHNFPNSLAQQILDQFKKFEQQRATLNQNIQSQIQHKLTAIAQAATNYQRSKQAISDLHYNETNATPAQTTAYREAIATSAQLKKSLDELTIFLKLKDKVAKYTINSQNGQRYYEANEPILLLAQKGTVDDVFNAIPSVYCLPKETPSSTTQILGKTLPNAPQGYTTTTATAFNQWLLMEWEVEYRPIDDPSLEETYHEDFIYDNFDIKPDTPDFTPIINDNHQHIPLSQFTRRYTGSSFVSGGTNNLLSQKLKDADLSQYTDVFNAADEILTDYHCFTQVLGGFNQALLMRKQTMQLEVADPIAFDDYQPLIKRIRQFIGDSRLSAPEPKHYFNPIRGGALQISRLKLINTFGQAVEIYNSANETRPITHAETIKLPSALQLPPQFEHQKDQLIYLPPRYTQPSRININWVSADWSPKQPQKEYDPNPICGWIAPNFLENNMFIFDKNGEYLGSIGVINDKIRLFPKPGDNAFHVKDIKNEHLRNFIHYFTDDSLGVDLKYLFTEFQKGIEDSLDYIEPQNYAQFPALSLLAGRPLALTRASFHLELMEDYAINQDWNIFKQDIQKTATDQRETYNFEKVHVPIRIGDYDLLNDGVIGFWYKDVGYVDIEEGKEKISTTRAKPYTINLEDALYMPLFQKEKTTRQAIIGKKKLQAGRGSFLIEQNLAEAPQIITLLIDPRGDMTVSSGVLPVKRVAIPPEYYKDILDKIQLYFLASPIITPFHQLQMPLLNYVDTKWNWVSVEKNIVSGLSVSEIPVAPSISKKKIEFLFKNEIAPEVASLCWNALIKTSWIKKSTNNDIGVPLFEVGNLADDITLGEEFTTQKEAIKTVLQELSSDTDGAGIEGNAFEHEYIEDVLSKDNIWQMLITAKWLKPMPEVEDRGYINFEMSKRTSLPPQYDDTMMNDLLNTHFEGIGHVNKNPEYAQNAIREGWLKMV